MAAADSEKNRRKKELSTQFASLVRHQLFSDAITVGTKAASRGLLDLSDVDYDECAMLALVLCFSIRFRSAEEERRIVTALFELILANGGFKHINAHSERFATPLLHACSPPPAIIAAELLVSHPAVDINARNDFGETALMLAAFSGLVGVCERLCSRITEIDLSLMNRDKQTAEQIANGLQVQSWVAADASNGLNAQNIARIRSLLTTAKSAIAEFRTIMNNVLTDASVPKVLIHLITQYTFSYSTVAMS